MQLEAMVHVVSSALVSRGRRHCRYRISRGMPDVEGEHVEVVRGKRAWAVESGRGIAGATS